jgi:hypothetical protein
MAEIQRVSGATRRGAKALLGQRWLKPRPITSF